MRIQPHVFLGQRQHKDAALHTQVLHLIAYSQAMGMIERLQTPGLKHFQALAQYIAAQGLHL
ncbi:hypothetical protein DBR00_11995 [Pseudomonas sp. HMWF032]|nr:hypothetical protein DBR00_11995 [Pseudomonas sp. HMWF032]PTT85440.1 hypothetical protein DBR41_04580 [Pseudomonas sp. HMWF010]